MIGLFCDYSELAVKVQPAHGRKTGRTMGEREGEGEVARER